MTGAARAARFFQRLQGAPWIEARCRPDSRTAGTGTDRSCSDWLLTLPLDVVSFLAFASETAERADLPEDVQDRIRPQVQRINARRSDPSFYVAVVGEPASGKTTLVQALLGRPVLPLPAPGAGGCEVRVRHHPNLMVEAWFSDGRNRLVRGIGASPAERMLRLLTPYGAGMQAGSMPERREGGQEDLAENMARAVRPPTGNARPRRVVLHRPSDLLADGLVLIDTPWSETAGRVDPEAARRVIRDEADALIVLIPATTRVTPSLLDLLTRDFRPAPQDTLFLITHMDRIAASEWESMLSGIRRRLARYLETEEFNVIPCAPRVVLDGLTGRRVEPEHAVWGERFGDVVAALKARLPSRTPGRAGCLARMTLDLLGILENGLRDRQSKDGTLQADQNREARFDLKSLIAEGRGRCREVIERAAARSRDAARRLVREHHRRVKEQSKNAIDSTGDAEALRAVINQRVYEYLHYDTKSLQNEINGLLKDLALEAESAARGLVEAIEEALTGSEDRGPRSRPELPSCRHSPLRLEVGKVPPRTKSYVAVLDGRGRLERIRDG
ncbi:MAG: dynamin family protein, partial [Proteobacteria bacterium]|nr:dynamin family protein [Pseudomonadota bacterium]